MFKIPIPCTEDSSCNVNKQSALADLFHMACMIVWDEVSMSHCDVFQAVDWMLQDVRNDKHPFGGLTVVFGGDFQQTLPRGSQEQIVRACLSKSPPFNHIQVFFLTENMHLRNNHGPEVRRFAEFQLDLGSGNNLAADGTLNLPEDLTLHGSTLTPLINHIYPDLHSNPPPAPSSFINHMILAPRNDDVHVLNHNMIDSFQASPANTKVYHSADSAIIQDELSDDIPVEFLNAINVSGMPVSKLTLKVGCHVILLHNLSTSDELCNGTIVIIAVLKDREVGIKQIYNGQVAEDITWIPHLTLEPSEQGEFHFTLRRRQLPLALAFAMTINKSQGQSVNVVGIDLRVPCFSHGQLYVESMGP